MIDFSYKIINQIKEAPDEGQLKVIIENSVMNLQSKKNNGFTAKWKYMMNMVMALRYIRAEGLTSNALTNVNKAIEIFETLRKQDHSSLF